MKSSGRDRTDESLLAERRKALVDKMIVLMESGEFHNRPEWSRYAFAPHNPVSNAVYKGGNRLRLMIEAMTSGYHDPRWLTYRQCQEQGWQVRRGEHGVACEKWIFTQERIKKNDHGVVVKDGNGTPEKETVYLEHPVCCWFTVFNAEQIDGIPQLELEENESSHELDDVIRQLIDTSECPVYEKMQGQAYYSPGRDVIILPPRQVFKDDVSFAKTLLHEMSHSTGHEDRLKRDLSGLFGTPSYAMEEMRAELGALFTETDMGLTLNAEHYEDHSDYLKSWIGVLRDDYNELFRAAKDAEAIADRLVSNYTNKYEIKHVIENKEEECECIRENTVTNHKNSRRIR